MANMKLVLGGGFLFVCGIVIVLLAVLDSTDEPKRENDSSGTSASVVTTATPSAAVVVFAGKTLTTEMTLTELSVKDGNANNCWIAVHNRIIDVTQWRQGPHPGGNPFVCGKDNTQWFSATAAHGDGSLNNLQALVLNNNLVDKVMGVLVTTKSAASTVTSAASGATATTAAPTTSPPIVAGAIEKKVTFMATAPETFLAEVTGSELLTSTTYVNAKRESLFEVLSESNAGLQKTDIIIKSFSVEDARRRSLRHKNKRFENIVDRMEKNPFIRHKNGFTMEKDEKTGKMRSVRLLSTVTKKVTATYDIMIRKKDGVDSDTQASSLETFLKKMDTLTKVKTKSNAKLAAADWSSETVIALKGAPTIGEIQAVVGIGSFKSVFATSHFVPDLDFSKVQKKAHPGSGTEFKTLIYIELKGGFDGAAGIMNVKDAEEINLYCSKRPTLAAAPYCTCSKSTDPETEMEILSGCTLSRDLTKDQMVALPEVDIQQDGRGGISRMDNTDGYLGMTDLFGGGPESWLNLWNNGDMSIVPGIGRGDHGRSHFEVKDAAAKGVDVVKEHSTSHGWLAKSIFAGNALYCGRSEANCPPGNNSLTKPDGTRMVDAISLANAAAGPNALEISDNSIDSIRYTHISGVKKEDSIQTAKIYDYSNPFKDMMMGDMTVRQLGEKNLRGSRNLRMRIFGGAEKERIQNVHFQKIADTCPRIRRKSEAQLAAELDMQDFDFINNAIGKGKKDYSAPVVLISEQQKFVDDNSERKLAVSTKAKELVVANPGLTELLAREESIFAGIGVLRGMLTDYMTVVNTKCPTFPPIDTWALGADEKSNSVGEIGLQLRIIAILMLNDVKPKVFQIQQMRYDTHSNQGPRLRELLGDLKRGVSIFVKTVKACSKNSNNNIWDDTLMTTFSDFGRRFEENSRKGTDHGWGSYTFAFGKNLRKKIFGYDEDKKSELLSDIIPLQKWSYDKDRKTKGDLQMTTKVESWNACLLDALALPGLPRLGRCPAELRLRDGLSNIPEYDETQYYKTANDTSTTSSTASDTTVSSSTSTNNNNDKNHLDIVLTPEQVLHFSRRVGFSPKSENLEEYILDPTKKLTLKQAISKVMENINKDSNDSTKTFSETYPKKVYLPYNLRRHNGLGLWNDERRKKRNNWNDLLQLPYPRYDPIERRLKRWGMDTENTFFKISNLNVPKDNDQNGILELSDCIKNGSICADGITRTEYDILIKLQNVATIFYIGQPIDTITGKAKDPLNACYLDDIKDKGTINYKKCTKITVNWYKTIMQTPDIKEIITLNGKDGAKKIMDDWTCTLDTTDNKYKNLAGFDCLMSEVDTTKPCDLNQLLNVDYDLGTAMIKNTKAWVVDGNGKDVLDENGKKDRVKVDWKILRTCVKTPDDRKVWENERHNQFKSQVKIDLLNDYYSDMKEPENGLRARISWFFQNFYATPNTIVNDWLLMYQQYYTLITGSLGSYRSLSLNMFRDKALRKSLDQLEEVECGTAPIENYAREVFERFTVGLRAHNEGDVKRLAQGLMNCKESGEAYNADLTQPGVIFTDPNEKLWTLTLADQKSVVDRILDYKNSPDEPPAAAQFLCGKLYNEFGEFPKVKTGEMLSTIGMPKAVVDCANDMYDHNYDITYALTWIFEDKLNFLDTLGKKKRWPYAVMIGGLMDYQITQEELSHHSDLLWWGTNIGQQAFEPQDVSGWDLDNVWTDDRVSQMHTLFSTAIKKRMFDNKFSKDDGNFENCEYNGSEQISPCTSKEKFKTTFAKYLRKPFFNKDKSGAEITLSATQLSADTVNADKDGKRSYLPNKDNEGKLYSLAPLICGGTFIPVKDRTGWENLNVDSFFDKTYKDLRKFKENSVTERKMSNKANRFNLWKDIIEYSIGNVCQFVS